MSEQFYRAMDSENRKRFEQKTKDQKKAYKEKQKELLDVIALECNILVHKTAVVLFQLEMKGLVRPLPGKLFEVI